MHHESFDAARDEYRDRLTLLASATEFAALRDADPQLTLFDSAEDVVAWLTGPSRDLDAKDDVYRALIEVHQRTGSQTALAIVVLGMWPGLDKWYLHLIRCSRDPVNAASELMHAVLERVRTKPIDQLTRVAASTVRSSVRDASKMLYRGRWAKACELPDDDVDALRRLDLVQEASEEPELSEEDVAARLQARFGADGVIFAHRMVFERSRAETAAIVETPLHQVDRSVARVRAALATGSSCAALLSSKFGARKCVSSVEAPDSPDARA